MESMDLGALASRMGMMLLAATPEQVTASIPVEGNTQPHGLLHGGASAVLAETVGSIAANLAAGPGRVAVGLELSVSHHRPVMSGSVTATATPAAVGRSFATFLIDIVDDAGRRSASARLTCAFRDQR